MSRHNAKTGKRFGQTYILDNRVCVCVGGGGDGGSGGVNEPPPQDLHYE